MPELVLIIGTGFAGLWSALSAKRLLRLKNMEADVEVAVVAPEPYLVMRPRLYEAQASGMFHDLSPLFTAAGIKYIKGIVETIDAVEQTVTICSKSDTRLSLRYDRLVVAAGSSIVRPPALEGITAHTFDIDSIEAATELERHLASLSSLPASNARDTVVICGGGFTGIELAAELPSRLGAGKRVVLVEGSSDIGPELGPGPRPTITRALANLGVEVKLGSKIASVDACGVILSSGERIETSTAVWTAGLRASSLISQVPGEKDPLGRVHVDQTLRSPSAKSIFVTGDSAHALTEPGGKVASMSCQHALILGRVSGHNAAADLIGEPCVDYSQAAYSCTLDLGDFGAVMCKGWERNVMLEGSAAKVVKQYVNRKLIYPPSEVAEAIAAAEPTPPDYEAAFKQVLSTVQTNV